MIRSSVEARHLALITIVSILLSVTIFAPRLWLMRDYVRGSFQWDRAHAFLLQCEQPTRRDIEPAMHWRLLPPFVCHGLRLPGRSPLAIPWFGIFAATAYSAVLFRRRNAHWKYVAGGTLTFATTSAVLVPVGWLGMNDAWVWLGLLAVAFGRAAWAAPIACLLCPWIDERFIVGFPLACVVQAMDSDEPLFANSPWSIAALAVYGGARLSFGGSPLSEPATAHFLLDVVPKSIALIPLAPLGWWMGLRAGWVLVGLALSSVKPRRRWVLAQAVSVTLVVSLALASDISRSAAIVLPVVFLGAFSLARTHPEQAPKLLFWIGLANVAIPAAHVVHNKIDPIHPLWIELVRLWRVA